MEKVAASPVRHDRPKWKKSFDFMFATLGCSVGLGNVWRFPYLCFKNGGGAFLIPYLLFAFLMGIPLVILETSLGQKVHGGLIKSWATVPVFKGISYAALVTVLHVNTYYPILLVWSFKYVVSSISSPLPWSHCNNTWNTPKCVAPIHLHVNTSLAILNSTVSRIVSNTSVSSAEEFWNREVLGLSSAIDIVGKVRWDLALYSAVLWLGFYLSTFKGIKWTAKIVYVTATLPFILIGVILIRGLTLDGAVDGIKYYLYPNTTKLKDPQVWVDAASQVFFSYAVCFGVLVVLGSYNKTKHNFWRDSVLIGGLNSITSFTSGFAVFSTLGFMAKYQNTTVAAVAKSGPGLAFIAYPETLSLLPLPQFWCAIFFLMLLFLGFDSQFVFQECLVAAFMDQIPKLRKHRYSREIIQGVFAFGMFLVGLAMLTEGGVYVFEIYNNYAVAGWCIFFIATCEFVAVGWCYGANRYWSDMVEMIGKRRGKLWIVFSWKFFGPAACSVLSLYFMVTNKPLTYNDYVYPVWAQVFGHIMSLTSVMMIPGFAAYACYRTWKDGGSYLELFGRQSKLDKEKDGFEEFKQII